MEEGYKGDLLGKKLLTNITADLDFTVPNVDFDSPGFTIPSENIEEWFKNTPKITLEDLTTKIVDGTGAFDVLMTSIKAHLKEEYDAGRITGAEYAKVYSAMVQAALQNAVQFLLNKDQAFWNAVNAQLGAVTANINTNTAKVQLAIAQAQAHTNKAQYAQTVLSLATEDAKFAATSESYESARAQTLDTRSDGVAVTGSVGKQKELYTEQATSYVRDREYKVAKMLADSWVTQKTIDEGLLPPESLKNDSVNNVLNKVISNNELQEGA